VKGSLPPPNFMLALSIHRQGRSQLLPFIGTGMV